MGWGGYFLALFGSPLIHNYLWIFKFLSTGVGRLSILCFWGHHFPPCLSGGCIAGGRSGADSPQFRHLLIHFFSYCYFKGSLTAAPGLGVWGCRGSPLVPPPRLQLGLGGGFGVGFGVLPVWGNRGDLLLFIFLFHCYQPPGFLFAVT